MQTRSKTALLAAFLLGAAAQAWAANPTLDGYERGIDDPSRHSKALRLGNLDLKIDVVGSIADTTLTARFENGSGDLLEGRFSFELPEGAVVTGYALDIDGRADRRRAGRAAQGQTRIPGAGARARRPGVAERVARQCLHGARSTRFPSGIAARSACDFPRRFIPNAASRSRSRRARRSANFAIDVRGQTRCPDAPVAHLAQRSAGETATQRPGGFSVSLEAVGTGLKGELRIAPVQFNRARAVRAGTPPGRRSSRSSTTQPRVERAAHGQADARSTGTVRCRGATICSKTSWTCSTSSSRRPGRRASTWSCSTAAARGAARRAGRPCARC